MPIVRIPSWAFSDYNNFCLFYNTLALTSDFFILKDDIKVLTNLAYAAVRRQAEEKDEQHHPFHDMMNDMSGAIDNAIKSLKKDEENRK